MLKCGARFNLFECHKRAGPIRGTFWVTPVMIGIFPIDGIRLPCDACVKIVDYVDYGAFYAYQRGR